MMSNVNQSGIIPYGQAYPSWALDVSININFPQLTGFAVQLRYA